MLKSPNFVDPLYVGRTDLHCVSNLRAKIRMTLSFLQTSHRQTRRRRVNYRNQLLRSSFHPDRRKVGKVLLYVGSRMSDRTY